MGYRSETPSDDPYRGEQMMLLDTTKADRFTKEADEWVRRNPEAWFFIRSQAVERTGRQKRFGIGELCEQVRWHMYAQGVTNFKVNNNHRAALARRLIKEYPPCEPYIQTRSSVVDL